jgi:hypothetical protein
MVAMFELIAERLPAYGEYYERVRERVAAGNHNSDWGKDASNERMCKALSYVYADIVEFCQEACKIFSGNKSGTLAK